LDVAFEIETDDSEVEIVEKEPCYDNDSDSDVDVDGGASEDERE
jgi:hypothetical protein